MKPLPLDPIQSSDVKSYPDVRLPVVTTGRTCALICCDLIGDESLDKIFNVFIYHQVIERLLSPLYFSNAVHIQIPYAPD